MSVTLSTNYTQALASKIVTIVDELVEDGYELQDVLETYDYFGDNFAENLKEILDCKEETGVQNSELWDFVDEHGIDNLQYFEKYNNLVDEYCQDSVNAYISLNGIEYLENFEYEGYFGRVEDFVEYILETVGEEIPSWIVVDYELTWKASLRFDYDEQDGYYFRKN
jgi:hypothetical protein